MQVAFGNYRKINIDAITALLLFFVLFLVLLFSYLMKVDNDIRKYSQYHDAMNTLKLIDKSFDNFLLQNSTFINYDIINREIKNFDDIMKFLHSHKAQQMFGEIYIDLLSDVKVYYYKKQEYIELFKSENSSLLNSIHYLFDLSNAIEKEYVLDQQNILVVKNTLLILMKFYINSYIDTITLKQNVVHLKQLLQNHQSIELEMFILHVNLNIERIVQLGYVGKAVAKSELSHSIDKLHIFMDESYQKNIFIQRIISVIMFMAGFVILIILLMMHRRSVRIKDELIGFKTAVERSDNSIVITDAQRNITYVNDVFVRETGYSREEVIGQNPRILKSGIAPPGLYEDLHQTLSQGKKWEGEFVNKRKDDTLYYEKASITPIFIHDKLVNYLAIKLNITEYIEQKREVEFLAYHDSLTSLPNRTNVEEYLQRRLEVAKRDALKLAVLFIDLDRFKMINDTLGHDVGDELLIESSRRIKAVLRESDMLARVGGDEFIVVLESLNDDYSAAQVCEKILTVFKDAIKTTHHDLNITLSIGVAVYPDDGNDYKTIFKHADVAMYKAKESGRNTYKYYQKQLSVDVHDRLKMEQALKEAIGSNEFYMVYQPKYKLHTKTIVALEALIRWENSLLGCVSPSQFIPIAEDSGYILDIGLYTFKQACRDFLELRQHCPSLRSISVNISAVQLYQKNFLNDLLLITNDVGIDPGLIVLEITESHIMKSIDFVMDVLGRFKKHGFDISIDDFGTGHSSMSYLKRFPIDELKIDKSFVDDLPHDQNDAAITKAIIALSKSLGYVNVAEGIENAEQEAFLRENGCEIGQGYNFCKPLRKEELQQFLNERCI